jgi:hypothetical protein
MRSYCCGAEGELLPLPLVCDPLVLVPMLPPVGGGTVAPLFGFPVGVLGAAVGLFGAPVGLELLIPGVVVPGEVLAPLGVFAPAPFAVPSVPGLLCVPVPIDPLWPMLLPLWPPGAAEAPVPAPAPAPDPAPAPAWANAQQPHKKTVAVRRISLRFMLLLYHASNRNGCLSFGWTLACNEMP